jgi:hypothetical protein
MTRAPALIAALIAGLALAGCAAPVVTRIDVAVPAPLPPAGTYTLATVPGEIAPVHGQAIALVTAALKQRGWREMAAGAGDYLLSVGLADRPAAAKLQAGDDNGMPNALLAPAADRKTTRGCARRDHRLSVVLTERVTGNDAYAASAAEFHCKARLEETVPYLVSAALEDLDRPKGVREVERAGVR